MDGGPMGPGNQRDLLESIPGKHKTVEIDDHPHKGILATFIFGLPGMLILWVAFRCAQDFFHTHHLDDLGWAVILGLFGALFVFPLVLVLYITFDSSRYLPLDVVSKRLHVSEEALVQIIEEKSLLLPRYMVNGRALYRLKAFDSLSLLRASEKPLNSAELVRAGSDPQTPSEQLLRESPLPDSPETPA